jgi:hypothetical protein
MRIGIIGAITTFCVAFSFTLVGARAALACPTGGEGIRPQVNVRPIQNVSLQASEMLGRASRIEAVAASHEMSARELERDAQNLLSRAQIVRNQATLVSVADRPSVLNIVDELVDRAESERIQAASERTQASELRATARALRERAAQLVRLNGGGGGGWRNRTALPSEASVDRSVTL